ncbi:MAG: hypothetical protein ACC645_14840 [Pirellulales bacterium]
MTISWKTMGRLPAVVAMALMASLLPAQRTVATPATAGHDRVFRAGAFAIDITPVDFPVIVNGGMTERQATKVVAPLHARCFVLDDGSQEIAIAIVDSCMIPRELADRAKAMASAATGIRLDHILISTTHTHSAPSVFGCLGSEPDQRYIEFLLPRIARGIELAKRNLVRARVGWAVGRNEENVACRRWLMKPGIAPTNPFGGTHDDRAQMHPGYGNQNAIRPTGPVDPRITLLSIQTVDGEPLALLANYSMHYVGAPAVSPDYFAIFCHDIARLIGVGNPAENDAGNLPRPDDAAVSKDLGTESKSKDRPFVAALSNGTSGDTWCLDHAKPRRKFDRVSVAAAVAQSAFDAYQSIEYHDWVPLVMEERLLTVDVRMPTEDEVVQAKEFMATFADRKPKNVPEVYARETVLLSAMPATRELKLQAIRLGELGIAAIPDEVFASTGLAIKEASPLKPTMVISLANGNEGYIPPPEQHALGGYTTWRARTSCLEVEAEPKIRHAVLELIDEVANRRGAE